MKKTLVVIMILAVTAGAVFLVMNQDNGSPSQQTSNSPTQQPITEGEDLAEGDNLAEQSSDAVTIVYDSSGFESRQYTVESGGRLIIQNNSDVLLYFASDDHPAHTDNPELNLGGIMPGESGELIVNRTGNWGFHNHMDAAHTGVLTVE